MHALDPSGLGVAMLYVGRRRRVGTFNPPFLGTAGGNVRVVLYVRIDTNWA